LAAFAKIVEATLISRRAAFCGERREAISASAKNKRRRATEVSIAVESLNRMDELGARNSLDRHERSHLLDSISGIEEPMMGSSGGGRSQNGRQGKCGAESSAAAQ
jgi:hypothetical protein